MAESDTKVDTEPKLAISFYLDKAQALCLDNGESYDLLAGNYLLFSDWPETLEEFNPDEDSDENPLLTFCKKWGSQLEDNQSKELPLGFSEEVYSMVHQKNGVDILPGFREKLFFFLKTPPKMARLLKT